MSIPINGWPICDVCNKPVEKIETYDDPLRDVRIYRATCHGQHEYAAIDHLTMINATSAKFCRAFVQPKLEGGK